MPERSRHARPFRIVRLFAAAGGDRAAWQAIYWFLFLLFRFVLRCDTGAMAITDVLLLVVIADAAQNAMAGEYTSITDGVLLVSTIAAWNWLLDWAAWRWPAMRHFVEGEALVLVRDGQPQRRAMRRELMSMDDLMAALREHGVERVEDASLVRMEKDGEISVIRREGGPPTTKGSTRQVRPPGYSGTCSPSADAGPPDGFSHGNFNDRSMACRKRTRTH